MMHTVIIGCGFGGLAATRGLAFADMKITLIDRSNHHLFQPLLYQVATAGLSAPANCSTDQAHLCQATQRHDTNGICADDR